MQTYKEYQQNLKNKIITKDMLLSCLYSSNKRAKNCRDKEREYRHYLRNNRYFYDKYDNIKKYQKKKEEYYKQKEIMLSILKPVCIHKELYGYEKERIYDYDKRYSKCLKKFVWENCFWDDEFCREVWFGDIEHKDKPLYHYYLFYDLNGNHTFHSPIDEKEIDEKYSDLDIVKIDRLETFGADIDGLISNQFVCKLIKLIESKDFTLDLN